MISGLPLGSHLATSGTKIMYKKRTFCRRVPSRVPGGDLGSIFNDFGMYFCVFLTLFYLFSFFSPGDDLGSIFNDYGRYVYMF